MIAHIMLQEVQPRQSEFRPHTWSSRTLGLPASTSKWLQTRLLAARK